eukprot:12804470-Alexandrium_andersonii.AAC.1
MPRALPTRAPPIARSSRPGMSTTHVSTVRLCRAPLQVPQSRGPVANKAASVAASQERGLRLATLNVG